MRTCFLIFCCMIMLGSVDAYAQRCGDDIWLFVRDANKKVIPPEAFDSVKVRMDDSPEGILDDKYLKEVPPGIKSFVIPTGCGYGLAKISLSYKGKVMVLEVINVPGDAGNILLESVPFREGTFQLDLKRWKLENCEFDPAI